MGLDQLTLHSVRQARGLIRPLATGPFPTELRLFAAQHGLREVVESDLGQRTDALLLSLKSGGFRAVLHKDHGEARKRFSLAHEIGHILLTVGATDVFRRPSCNGSAIDPIERECNQLATEMLMPAEAFAAHAARLGQGMSSLERLGQIFNTSFEATARRLVEVSAEPLAFIKWRINSHAKPWHVYNPVVTRSAPRVVGFDRRYRLIDIPSLCEAYTHNGIHRGHIPLETITGHGRGSESITSWAESRGFGKGNSRFVYTICRLGPLINKREP